MSKINDLVALAQPQFGEFTGAEREMLERAATRESIAHLDDLSRRTVSAAEWHRDRYVRAELVRWLCVSHEARQLVDPRGVRITSSYVDGELDLSFVNIPFPLALRCCRLNDACILDLAEIPRIDFTGAWIASISAEGSIFKGTANFTRAHSAGRIKLDGAKIGGHLICDGSRLENPTQAGLEKTGTALSAEGARIGGAVLLREGFCAEGRVSFFSAQIEGGLECEGATFNNPAQVGLSQTGIALRLEASSVGGSVLFRKGFKAIGKVSMDFSKIGGTLDCDGGTFENAAQKEVAQSGTALSALGVNVAGSVLLRSDRKDKGKCSFRGGTLLTRAQIGGTVECDGSEFDSPPSIDRTVSGFALNLEGANVTGSVWLRRRFHALGRVHLYNTRIGGDLICDGGVFENPALTNVEGSGLAMDAGGAAVSGSVFLRGDSLTRAQFLAKGAVNLVRTQIGRTLECDGGRFENPLREGVNGSGVALRVYGASISGDVLLRKGFVALGQVNLFGVRVGGNIECDGGTFENPPIQGVPGGGTAINAGSAKIAGNLLLRSKVVDDRGIFTAKGVVHLFGVQVGGAIECDGGHFDNPARAGLKGSGVALQAAGVNVTGNVSMRRSTSLGKVDLTNAQIGGNLDCDGGMFENPPVHNVAVSGVAFDAALAKISGGVSFRSGDGRGNCFAKGSVSLFGAKIEGALECDGSMFENPSLEGLGRSGVALHAGGANVSGHVLLRENFRATGQVNLFNASVGRSLNCVGGKFENAAIKGIATSGVAFNADLTRVAGSVLLRSGGTNFSSKGIVSLSNAHIEGNLDCNGGKFENSGDDSVDRSGIALRAKGVTIAGDVLLGLGFAAEGLVQFSGAEIGGSVSCVEGKFRHEGNGVLRQQGTSLDATNLKVAKDFLLNRGLIAEGAITLRKARISGRLETNGGLFSSLDLRDASVGAVVDGVDEKDWKPEGILYLEGFTYQRISREPPHDLDDGLVEMTPLSEGVSNIPNRLRWLALQTGFTRQPYLQLARVLRDAGNEKGFSQVCIGMESRALDGRSWWRRSIGYLLGWTIGYGYASQRAILWILGLIVIGTSVYWHGVTMMVPAQKDAYAYLQCFHDTPANYGRFHAFVYSMDNSFPLIKLGVQEKWIPKECTGCNSTTRTGLIREVDARITSSLFLRSFRIAQVCIGWILTTLFAVGVTGVIRKA
jgi:hypothetical protein